jgi:urea transport system ATP-binding protein
LEFLSRLTVATITLLCEQYYDFAEELADHYWVMERGEVIAQGPGSEMPSKGIRQLVSI